MSVEHRLLLVIPVNNQDTTVADYMLYKHERRLRYPGLPCVIERRIGGKDKRPYNSFHPMEVLEVVKGQRVDIKKQTPELIRVMNSPKATDAIVQFPPAIVYNNGKVEPSANGDLDWRLSVPRGMQNKIFFRPATAPRRWVVFMFQRAVDQQAAELAQNFSYFSYTGCMFADLCGTISLAFTLIVLCMDQTAISMFACDVSTQLEVSRFIAAYVNRSRDHGIQMPNPSRSEEYDRTDMSFLIEKIEFMRKNGVEYILFITRDKHDPVHGKALDILQMVLGEISPTASVHCSF
ncbi:unnamed protein product [Gongylonema pulchrum]|uniref:PAZ domain-containing protein n=1 Tax=Gongylonema pulchrum TaxID=637853 RepID=A0A183EST9_9BILA|nr:unnamed protein product [Gongylonema pulchrum]